MRTLARWANSIVNHPNRFVWKCCITPNPVVYGVMFPINMARGIRHLQTHSYHLQLVTHTHIYTSLYPGIPSNHHFYPLVNCLQKTMERSTMLSMGNSTISPESSGGSAGSRWHGGSPGAAPKVVGNFTNQTKDVAGYNWDIMYCKKSWTSPVA